MHELSRFAARGSVRSASFGSLGGYRFCRLTTFEPGDSARIAKTRFALDGERLLIRAPARSDLVSRTWRSTAVTVAPCTRIGSVAGPAMEADARVLRAHEEPPAEAAVGAHDRLLERMALWLRRRRGVDLLYIEIVPADRGSKPGLPPAA